MTLVEKGNVILRVPDEDAPAYLRRGFAAKEPGKSAAPGKAGRK